MMIAYSLDPVVSEVWFLSPNIPNWPFKSLRVYVLRGPDRWNSYYVNILDCDVPPRLVGRNWFLYKED